MQEPNRLINGAVLIPIVKDWNGYVPEHRQPLSEWGIQRCDNLFLELVKEAGIPKEFIGKVNLDQGDYDLFIKDGGKYFVQGIHGSGKTHFVCSLIQEYLCRMVGLNNLKRKSVRFYRSIVLFREMRDTFGSDSERTESDLFNELLGYDYLFIDDLGADKVSDWVETLLYSLVTERLEDGKALTITSNLSIDELAETYGERITQRVLRYCKVIEFEGRD